MAHSESGRSRRYACSLNTRSVGTATMTTTNRCRVGSLTPSGCSASPCSAAMPSFRLPAVRDRAANTLSLARRASATSPLVRLGGSRLTHSPWHKHSTFFRFILHFIQPHPCSTTGDPFPPPSTSASTRTLLPSCVTFSCVVVLSSTSHATTACCPHAACCPTACDCIACCTSEHSPARRLHHHPPRQATYA